MKKNISKELTLIPSILATLLIVSVLISFLYMMDWIGTSLFTILCEGLGFLFYGALGIIFCRIIPKRVMIPALIFAVVMIIAYFFTQGFELLSFFIFIAKLLVFLGTVVLFKKKTL